MIFSECQKVIFLGVEAKKFGQKMEKKQSCLQLPDLARKLIENGFFFKGSVNKRSREGMALAVHS